MDENKDTESFQCRICHDLYQSKTDLVCHIHSIHTPVIFSQGIFSDTNCKLLRAAAQDQLSISALQALVHIDRDEQEYSVYADCLDETLPPDHISPLQELEASSCWDLAVLLATGYYLSKCEGNWDMCRTRYLNEISLAMHFMN